MVRVPRLVSLLRFYRIVHDEELKYQGPSVHVDGLDNVGDEVLPVYQGVEVVHQLHAELSNRYLSKLPTKPPIKPP